MSRETIESLEKIFHPRSVAIIGASNKEGSFGRTFVQGFVRTGFEKVYPVNPRDTEVMGFKAYAGVTAIPYEVDVGVIITPTQAVLGAVKECAEKGLKGVIIITSGFGESSAEGAKIEQEIAAIARASGMRIVGPNSLGLYSPASRFVTLIIGILRGFPTESGPLGVFSQSGAISDFLTYNLALKGIRFSKVVSTGNECDLTAPDYLEYFGQDPETKIIAAYIEGIRDGRRFYQLAKSISRQKPVILWKAGTTEAGARAAASHTGALAGSRRIWEAMFEQAGIVNVNCFEEMLDCANAFYHLPLPGGKRLAIVCGQGGIGVGTSDNAVNLGLELARLSDDTCAKLQKEMPPVGTSFGNPVDIGPIVQLDPDVHGRAIGILASDKNVDMILLVAVASREVSESIVKVAKGLNKTLAVAFLDLPELTAGEHAYLSENGVAAFSGPCRAAFALSKLYKYAKLLKRK